MSLPVENVQDYPRPPRLETVSSRIEVYLGETIVARTTRAVRILETHHAPTYYIPPDDIRAELRPVPGGSLCEWKGRARYFDVHCDARIVNRAAWCYPSPTRQFGLMAGCIAFYAGLMDRCFVDGVPAEPQPGSFYGGWVTPNLTGIPKGAAGTEHW